jgi:hypothetical protein
MHGLTGVAASWFRQLHERSRGRTERPQSAAEGNVPFDTILERTFTQWLLGPRQEGFET